jgi:hypothetical protein
MVKDTRDTITSNIKTRKNLSIEDESLSKSLVSKIKALLSLNK